MIFYHTEARFVKQDAAFFRQAALFPAGKCFFDRRRVPRHSIRGNPPSREISHAILKAADEPRRDSLSPAGSVRARENDPPDRFLTRARSNPGSDFKNKKTPQGRFFVFVSGVRKRWICVFDGWIRTHGNDGSRF